MKNPVLEATVKATGEVLAVYKLNNGNYYDYDNMGAHLPPFAAKSNKKEFQKSELIIGRELERI